MTVPLEAHAHTPAAAPARHPAERRREARTEAERPVWVQPAGDSDPSAGEVCAMLNFSPDGFYFQSAQPAYQPGMELYCIPDFGCLNLEYVGRVVRVEPLPDAAWGVAVKLLRVRALMDRRPVAVSP